MKFKLFLSSLFFLPNLSFAATAVNGMYASVFGGYTQLPANVDVVYYGALRSDPSFSDGYNVGGRLGYQSHPLRYELEYTYLTAHTHYFKVNYIEQTGVSGNSGGDFVMANIYYDCRDMLPAVSPFLGVGIGYAFVQTTLDSTGPFRKTVFSASDNAFAYQATIGLTYNFAENYALNIAYRYTGTTNLGNMGDSFQSNSVNAGAIYRFDRVT